MLAAGDAAAAMQFASCAPRDMTWNRSMRACSSTSATACCSPSATARDGRRFPERYSAAYAETAQALGAEGLLRMLALATEEEQAFRRSSQRDLVLEVLLVRLALLDRTVDLDRALRALGAGGGGGPPAPAGQRSGELPGRAGGSKRRRSRRVRKRRRRRAVRSRSSPCSPRGTRSWRRSSPRPTVAASLKDARPSDCRDGGVTLTLPPHGFQVGAAVDAWHAGSAGERAGATLGIQRAHPRRPAGDQPPDAMPASPARLVIGSGRRGTRSRPARSTPDSRAILLNRLWTCSTPA